MTGVNARDPKVCAMSHRVVPAWILDDDHRLDGSPKFYIGNLCRQRRIPRLASDSERPVRPVSECETGDMAKQETVSLRKHLENLLRMKGAHVAFEAAVADFPVKLRGAKPHGVPHSAWELLEHMRMAQEDILDFSRNPEYRDKTFPDDYWPATVAPPNDEAWENAVRQFQRDLKEMQALVADTASDMLARIPHGQGQTLLREAL